MNSKIGVTFGILIAHFVPGMLVLLSICLNVEGSSILENKLLGKLIDNTTLVLSVALLISCAFGLILDAVRFVLFWVLRLTLKWGSYSIKSMTVDDTKIHDWIIEHHFRFHQFYGNISLALIIIILVLRKTLCTSYVWILLILTIVCLIAAILSYKRTIFCLREKFPE